MQGACVFILLEEKTDPDRKTATILHCKALENNWQLFERKPSVGKKVASLVPVLQD
jgi:hypothetical protein